MIVVPFERRRGSLIVAADVAGPRGRARVSLVLDTGASRTILAPEVLDLIGYSARDGVHVTYVTSPLGREAGYFVRIGVVSCFGTDFPDFLVTVQDFADAPDFDGLLGLDLLDHFNYEIRSKEGRVRAEPA